MTQISIAVTCPFCGTDHIVEVDFNGWLNYMGGMAIQRAFPKMSATDREKLITGMCEACQNDIF